MVRCSTRAGAVGASAMRTKCRGRLWKRLDTARPECVDGVDEPPAPPGKLGAFEGLGDTRVNIPVKDTPPPKDQPDASAADRDGPHSMATLLPQVYEELRALAADQLKRRPGHTIQPTALVHEAFIKMAGRDKAWSSREHFMATAATAMRHVLVDRLRKKTADKRGGDAKRADLDVELIADESGVGPGLNVGGLRVLELDELLSELARADPRAAAGVEMRLFGGMDQNAIALVQGVSRTIVASDWHFARAWLAARMNSSDGTPAEHTGGPHGV